MKLTYDQLTETEKQIMSLAWQSIAGTGLLEQTFIEGLRKIMPPICTPTERAFLDEIRENGEYVVIGKNEYIQMKWGKPSAIYQSDFKCKLQELVEGKSNDHT